MSCLVYIQTESLVSSAFEPPDYSRAFCQAISIIAHVVDATDPETRTANCSMGHRVIFEIQSH